MASGSRFKTISQNARDRDALSKTERKTESKTEVEKDDIPVISPDIRERMRHIGRRR